MRGKSSKHNGSGGRRAKSSSHASTAGNGSATMNQEELTGLIYQTKASPSIPGRRRRAGSSCATRGRR